MQLLYKADWEETKERFKKWWAGEYFFPMRHSGLRADIHFIVCAVSLAEEPDGVNPQVRFREGH